MCFMLRLYSSLFSVAPYGVKVLGNVLYSQGDRLILHCTSEGGPQLEYSWEFLGDVISNSSMLIIDNVNTTHGGEYICNVTNNAGYESDSVTVYGRLLKFYSIAIYVHPWMILCSYIHMYKYCM